MLNRLLIALAIILGTLPSYVLAQTERPDSLVKASINDSLVDQLDALLMPQVDESMYADKDSTHVVWVSRAEVKAIPDSVFIARLELLDDETPFHLSYNRYVRMSIENYLSRHGGLTAKMVGKAELYFPMFEEVLDREGLPLELKYLAVVESALNPTARSRAGATGLWQFMYGTAKENGLRITSYVDERKSPRLATEAACKYLKFLYGMYGDWNLALAAYNSGPGNVNKAIRRAGGKADYWEIWSHLPRETRGYVPAFIAVNYAMNYYEEHGIQPTAPTMRYSACDTILVDGPMSFSQISKYTETEMDVLRMLNPHYHRDYIPKGHEQIPLLLPRADVAAFIENQEAILAYEAEQIKPAPTVTSSRSRRSSSDYYSTEGLVKSVYTVRSGDVIGVIADRHGVGLSKLRYWNNISGSRIYPGQKLVIWQKPGSGAVGNGTSASTKKKPEVQLDPNARYHTIRPGDTLWDIAKLYDGVSVSEIKKWNAHLNFKRLKPGQKVRVSG